MIIVLAGNAGVGVQVSTVLPALHTEAVWRGDKGLLMFRKEANVSSGSGSMASLNLKTMAVDGESPLAGGGDMMVGWA
jgi:hypothetical protein